MTVYRSVDEADVWASFKRPLPETNPSIDHELAEARVQREKLDKLSLMDRQCFELLDDLQRLTPPGCVLGDAEIGSIQAKLSILRINLNIRHGVNTPQLN
jgi:hypothetical protein